MKKLITFALVAVLLSACRKEGEITAQSENHILINGNEYRFVAVVPANGYSPVWLLIPNDAKIEVPQPTMYRASCGKNCTKSVEVILMRK